MESWKTIKLDQVYYSCAYIEGSPGPGGEGGAGDHEPADILCSSSVSVKSWQSWSMLVTSWFISARTLLKNDLRYSVLLDVPAALILVNTPTAGAKSCWRLPKRASAWSSAGWYPLR